MAELSPFAQVQQQVRVLDGGDRIVGVAELGVRLTGVAPGLRVGDGNGGTELGEFGTRARAGKSRMSSVFGLNATPQTVTRLPMRLPSNCWRGP